MHQEIKLAIAGIGNCASALIQGLEYYRHYDPTQSAGLIHPEVGGYRIENVSVVAAFDIDRRKVGKPLHEAIFAEPNCTTVFQREFPDRGVTVQMGPVLDSIAPHMEQYPESRAFRIADQEPVDVAKVLDESEADILVCYLPVGSEEAVRHYVLACLDDIVDSVIRDLVSASPLVELVRSTTWQASESDVPGEPPRELAAELMREIQLGREEMTRAILAEVRKMTPQYGIEVVDVRIKHLNYVQSVREKVYDRMISERKRIASRYRSEGEGRSAEILGNMEKELRDIRSTAYRRVQEIRGEADASATRIYGEAYGRDPEFYAFSRTLEEYKEKQNDNIILVLTTDSDFYRYLKKAAPPPE